jgi:Protein of unknown function (DUF1573)
MNSSMAGFLLSVTLSALVLANARAELKWDQTTLELHPAYGDKEAVGHFKYQNSGVTPVRFKSVKTSCGCTAAQSQRKEVAPGEKGEVTATFKIGDRTGTQVKTVTVETDEPAHAVTLLTLKAVLPEMLTISPTFVFWAANEEAKPKTISVKAGKDFMAKNLAVTSTNADFVTKVEQGSAGEWKIIVQPKQTNRAMAAALTIKPDFPKDAPKVFYANVSVTGAPAAPPTAPLAR